MGVLLDGVWSDEVATIADGAYKRPASPLRNAGSGRVASEVVQHPRRFWLIASNSCPWSHRAVLLHGLKQLESVVPIHFAFGERLEGYAVNGGRPWAVPGSEQTVRHLHQLYALHNGAYTGRASVPVLWDSAAQTIVSNESADILQLFDALPSQAGRDFTVRPEPLVAALDEANEQIYLTLNHAVYQAGFARAQSAYEEAALRVFEALDGLEDRLSSSRYYFGNTLTETDLRLFPTLVRFDAVYHILFKCSIRRLVDYPQLWAYARDLYGWRRVAQSVDFQTIRNASYLADSRDPHPLIALQPDVDWDAPHDRGRLGAACLTTPDGRMFKVEPATMAPHAEPHHA
ncbi:MAG: glutathione-dependent reductase [Alphaproteobacteria bacterium]|nr:glutathione-dependent reductase [Alphaproteobacteria bacterium]